MPFSALTPMMPSEDFFRHDVSKQKILLMTDVTSRKVSQMPKCDPQLSDDFTYVYVVLPLWKCHLGIYVMLDGIELGIIADEDLDRPGHLNVADSPIVQ
jgi:hypothetical protein